MKIAIVLGTRPEIIKMSPIIRECVRRGLDYYILHTGQHYSFEMDRLFFDELKPPSEPYRDLLIEAGCEIMVHDPYVLEYPGVVAVLTGHDEYFSLDAGVLKGLMGQEHPVVVDGRNVVDADGFIGAGFVYKGIGRGDKNGHDMQ